MKNLLAFAMIIAISAMAKNVHADFVLSGSTTFTTSGGGSGTINYAVYKTEGTDWAAAGELNVLGVTTSLISGDPPADSETRYVYLYEIVNTSPSLPSPGNDVITEFNLTVPTNVIDAGYIDKTGFGTVTPTTTVVANALAVAPSGANAVDFGGVYQYQFQTFLTVGSKSALLYVSSNAGPRIGVYDVATRNPLSTASGNVPVPVPLPASLALLATAIPGLFGINLFLRLKQQWLSGA